LPAVAVTALAAICCLLQNIKVKRRRNSHQFNAEILDQSSATTERRNAHAEIVST
jgi:hypothetical protein